MILAPFCPGADIPAAVQISTFLNARRQLKDVINLKPGLMAHVGFGNLALIPRRVVGPRLATKASWSHCDKGDTEVTLRD